MHVDHFAWLVLALSLALPASAQVDATPCNDEAPCAIGAICIEYRCSLAPPTAPSREPRRTDPHSGPHRTMIGGGVTLLVAWIANIAISSLAGYRDGPGPGMFDGTIDHGWDAVRLGALLPVLGPWFQLVGRPAAAEQGWPPFLVIDGVVQLLGLAVLVTGAALDDAADDVPWSLTPLVGETTLGVVVGGTM